MKLKTTLSVFLMCTIVVGCLFTTAGACTVSDFDGNVVCLNDLEGEWVDPEMVGTWEEEMAPYTTGSINKSIPGHSIYTVSPKLSLKAGNSVRINCSYSPSPGSVDFGLLSSDNRFYSVNVKGGSINQTIVISESGSYSVAVRNNTSQKISVVGFVDY